MAAAVAIFAGGVYLGGNILGVWEGVPAAPAAAEPPMASTVRLTGAQPSERLGRVARKASARRRKDPHAPRERLTKADTALARKAVLRFSDMRRGTWEATRPITDGGPGCPANDPDLSRFSVTGKAASAFRGNESVIESHVTLFANAEQAALFFEATSNRAILRCIREGVKGALRKAGLQPRVVYARLEKEPPVGARTAIYVIAYVITLSDGRLFEYPVDVITFQVGRAVGAVSFNLVPSDDGLRPCACELEEARLVASRLYRT